MKNEISDNLRTAIIYSKRPGNESQFLANAKGFYRPVAEILTPAYNTIEAASTFSKALEDILEGANSGTNSGLVIGMIQNEFKVFKISLDNAGQKT